MRRCMAARLGGDHRQRPPPLTFPPSFPHSTRFPHWISQNEIIKDKMIKINKLDQATGSGVMKICILQNVKLQVTDNNYRPDLTEAALARLSAVNRSLKVAKSGAKKWNSDFEVDYGSKEHVTIVFAALDVDKESDKVKRQMSISDGRLIVKILHGERMGRNQPYRFIKMLEYCSLWHYTKRYWENVTG